MKFKAIEKLGTRISRRDAKYTWTQVRIIFDTFPDDPCAMQMLYVPTTLVDEFIEFMLCGPRVLEAAHDLVDNHFDPVFCALDTRGLMPTDEVNEKVGKLWGALNAKVL